MGYGMETAQLRAIIGAMGTTVTGKYY